MSYRTVFPKRNTLLLVIHAVGTGQVLRNAGIAQSEGADGIFLINHGEVPASSLYRWYEEVRSKCPGFWVGLNCLDLDSETAIRIAPHDVGGIWVDVAGIGEGERDPAGSARRLAELRRARRFSGIYFGSVAFKYQAPIKDPAYVATLAAPYVDVVTTSGTGTGIAADIRKIRAMKKAINDRPLAIASGITSENVSQYLEYADCFLVATGVSNSHTELNPARVRQLVRAISG